MSSITENEKRWKSYRHFKCIDESEMERKIGGENRKKKQIQPVSSYTPQYSQANPYYLPAQEYLDKNNQRISDLRKI